MRTLPYAALTIKLSFWTRKINRSQRHNRVLFVICARRFYINYQHTSYYNRAFYNTEMELQLPPNWSEHMSNQIHSTEFQLLNDQVCSAYNAETVFPPFDTIFAALEITDLTNIKVVILGQDPYHQPGQAHGLAFSVQKTQPIPPSLKNILKEVNSDIGDSIITNGDLTSWATQGVLLLNSILTVPHNQAAGHKNIGWEYLTDAMIKKISEQPTSTAFLLWGNFAISKKHLIDSTKHLILTTTHPSPLSAHRGFLGCKHFSQANKFLIDNGRDAIIW